MSKITVEENNQRIMVYDEDKNSPISGRYPVGQLVLEKGSCWKLIASTTLLKKLDGSLWEGDPSEIAEQIDAKL